MDVESRFKLGRLGEEYALKLLETWYPEDKYMVLNMENLFNCDFVVVDKDKKTFVAIFEVKATRTNNDHFLAGSRLQCELFNFQKKGGGVPYFLFVVRVDKESWNFGNFEVLGREIYPLTNVEINEITMNNETKINQWRITNPEYFTDLSPKTEI